MQAAKLAEQYGLPLQTVYKRLKRGVPLDAPFRRRGPRRHPFNVAQAARERGMSYGSLRWRLERGEPLPPKTCANWRTPNTLAALGVRRNLKARI